jgi:NADPH:quinone reductase
MRSCGFLQVLVRIHAVGLNKFEGMIRMGMIPIPPPIVLGTDAAGVVEEVGSGDSHFKVGISHLPLLR